MKYLIYKGTGGLVHMLNGIQSAVNLCKLEKRELIIDTEQLTAFKKKFSEYFFIYDKEINYYTGYDKIDLNLEYKGIEIKDIIWRKAQFRDGKYYLEKSDICIQKHHNDNNNDKIRMYAGHSNTFIENIRLKNNILYKIFDSTIEIIEKYKKYISVHFRNTDMKNSISEFIYKINEASVKYKINNIFIATDDSKAFDTFVNYLPNLNFFRIHEAEDCGENKNIHYHYKDKDYLIMSILKDIFVIINSQYFIPSKNSGVSQWIKFQKNSDHRLFDCEYNFKII